MENSVLYGRTRRKCLPLCFLKELMPPLKGPIFYYLLRIVLGRRWEEGETNKCLRASGLLFSYNVKHFSLASL